MDVGGQSPAVSPPLTLVLCFTLSWQPSSENPSVRDSALFSVLTTFHEPTKDKAWWTWEDKALR